MVQPKYSPQEALERVKLMMKYDTSKTLNENKEIIKEQYVAPTVAAGATGAALGASAVAASTTTAGASIIVPVMSALGVGATAAGAIVGGAAALAVLPLVYWLATKDTGANKVKKMIEMCSTDATKISKLPRKMSDRDFRDISDNIEDAINDTTLGIKVGTDEEKLFTQFKRFQDGTASDFCAFVTYYNRNSDSGDLFDDLDSDIDAEDEWKQIYRPIRNCVEDSLLTIKDEVPTTTSGGTGNTGGGKGNSGGYTDCTSKGIYSKGCKTDPSGAIGQVQSCLGLVVDGKYGKNTDGKLKEIGYNSFKDEDIQKICNKQPDTSNEPTPEVGGEDMATDATNLDF
jgi:hypothetical protein